MSDTHPLGDIPVCTPPRSWMLDDGTTIRKGSRVRPTPTGDRDHPMPAGATGTVVEFAGPGWALVRWDRGGQALTQPSDLAIEPPRSAVIEEAPPPSCHGMK